MGLFCKSKKLRGQGATEYLVILGAVLLVALVIVSLLGWFPSLGGSTREQQSKSYWSGATPFAITSLKANGSGVVLSVSNRLSHKLLLTSINFSDGANSLIVLPLGNTNYTLNAGEEIVITNVSLANSLNPCYIATGTKAGSPFSFKTIIFTYQQGTISDIKQTGSQGLNGRCS